MFTPIGSARDENSGPNEYQRWAGCGVGSFVVFETTIEAPNPGRENLRAFLQNPPPEVSAEDLAKLKRLDIFSNPVKHVMTTTVRLLEIAKDRAKLECVNAVCTFGSSLDSKTTKTVRADAGRASKKKQVWTSKHKGGRVSVVKTPLSSYRRDSPPIESFEELVIGRRNLRCRSVEATYREEGFSTRTKTWFSEEIPGGIARWETRMGEPSQQSSRMIVTRFEKV